MNIPHCYKIVVDGIRCYSYEYAQKQYSQFIESDKTNIKVSLYQFKNDLKPKYEFLINKDQPLKVNLFLHLLYMIEIELHRKREYISKINDKKIKKEEEEYLEKLEQAEKEAEEWYIDFVIEKEKQNDLWLYSLLLDPYTLNDFQYYSPADIVYMSYNLGLLDRNSSVDDLEEHIENIADIDLEDLVFRYETSCHEHRINPNFHEEKVNYYASVFEKNPYIKKRILKNNNAYKNLHKIKSIKKTKCRKM